MADIVGITDLKKLNELLYKVKKDKKFDHTANVFINCKDELAITCSNEFGYSGYFLNFQTGKITHID